MEEIELIEMNISFQSTGKFDLALADQFCKIRKPVSITVKDEYGNSFSMNAYISDWILNKPRRTWKKSPL